nr:MAG TPA: hypothetical protein [Caudoviricetes sp.]
MLSSSFIILILCFSSSSSNASSTNYFNMSASKVLINMLLYMS